MEGTARTVRLAEGAPFDVSSRGVTATLRRADIEEAARSGVGPAELVLDVRRGQGADVEAHSIAVEWSAADLERLLGEGEAGEVTIAFDRDEMTSVMDAEADVEAHGLREKALVLTVVAVSAASTAGVAQAHPTAVSAGGAATAASAPAAVQAPAATIGGADTAGPLDPALAPATTIGGAGLEPTDIGHRHAGLTGDDHGRRDCVSGACAVRVARDHDGRRGCADGCGREGGRVRWRQLIAVCRRGGGPGRSRRHHDRRGRVRRRQQATATDPARLSGTVGGAPNRGSAHPGDSNSTLPPLRGGGSPGDDRLAVSSHGHAHYEPAPFCTHRRSSIY